MPGRAIRVTSRIVFFVCGVASLLTGAPYVILQGVALPVQSEWVIFVVALALLGVFNLAVAVLPRSWIAKACKKDRDDARLFSAPLKMLGGFAAIAYLVALLAYFAPHSWNLDPQLMFVLCPMYFLKDELRSFPGAYPVPARSHECGGLRRPRIYLGIRVAGLP